jgi:uncharacterized tellurite resistance protein B-like protein
VRKYTTNSPEAGARVVALALMADGAIDRSEIVLLERQNVLGLLGLDAEQFDSIYYEFCTDMLASARRNASGLLELDQPFIKALLDEISDPALQKKILRITLDIANADHRLTTGEASLIALTLERWSMELCGMTESSVPRHRPSFETLIQRDSTALSKGGNHRVATG